MPFKTKAYTISSKDSFVEMNSLTLYYRANCQYIIMLFVAYVVGLLWRTYVLDYLCGLRHISLSVLQLFYSIKIQSIPNHITMWHICLSSLTFSGS